MRKRLKGLLTGLLLLAVLVSMTLPVMAADMPPMEGGMPPAMPEGGPPAMPGGEPPAMPGGGGPAAAGQEFATYEEVRSHAGILVENEKAEQNHQDSDFTGLISMDQNAEVSASRVSGLILDGGELSNGIAVEMASEADVFTVGGEDTPNEYEGKQYNTIIDVTAGEGNNDAGYEAVHGVGVGINTGELHVINSYISANGPRSTPIYAFSTQSPGATSVVVRNSKLVAHSDSIWMPPFKLLAGGARATLLMTRNNSWFYGSEVESNNWGAISQDSVDAMTYVVNSSGISTEGGYATYLTYGMRLYGSDLYAGQYGVFMCGSSDILTDTGAAALEDVDAMSKAPDFSVNTDRRSNVVAPFNAIVIHNSLPDYTMVAKGVFCNTLVSTMAEHLPENVTPMAYDDSFFMPGVDIIGSGAGCGASYFYNKNLYGSLALIRSMNADLTFDAAETATSNGVLVHSVITYDPPSAVGYLTPQQSGDVSGVAAAFYNGDYQGDILHQDYHRAMNITIGENATLTGKAVSGTWGAWNDLWSEERLLLALESDGYTADVFNNDLWVEDVQANLVRSEDTVYADTENTGISMTVESSGTWVVTGDSSLKHLTLEEGAEIIVPNGCTMTVYAGCDTSNSLLFYDESSASEVVELAPGTYDDVVIRISGTPIPEVPEEPETSEAVVPAETPAAPSDTVSADPTPEQAPIPEEPPVPNELPTQQADRSPLLPIVLAIFAFAAVAVIVGILRKNR